MSKEKRKFKRYQKKSDFVIVIGTETYHAITQDYSLDGVSAFVEGTPPLKVGDVINMDIPVLGMKTSGRVMRMSKVQGGYSIGVQRVGLLYGSLLDFRVSDLLLGLQRSHKTGVMHIKSGSIQKNVFFERGDMIFASSNLQYDWLGDMLLRERKITSEQYGQSVEVMKTTGKRHGAVLVDMEILKPAELFPAVKRCAEGIILSLFTFKDGEFLFKEGPLPTEEVIKLKLSAANLIYKGIKQITDIETVRALCPAGDSILCFSTDPLDLFQDLNLEPDDKKLFRMVDGKKSFKDLIRSSGMDSFNAMRALCALIGTRVIEVQDDVFASRVDLHHEQTSEDGPKPAPKVQAAEKPEYQEEEPKAAPKAAKAPEAPEAPKKAPEPKPKEAAALDPQSMVDEILSGARKNDEEDLSRLTSRIEEMYREYHTLGYYGVLEIPEDAAVGDIKRAYYKMAKEYHPDRHYQLPSDMKEKLNTIFTYITTAYSTLSNPTARSEYDSDPDKHIKSFAQTDPAEKALEKFNDGLVLYKGGRFEQASRLFAEAAYLDGEVSKYHYYSGLSLSRLNKPKDADRAMQRALKLDPLNADYLAESGFLYIALGLHKRAKGCFERALKIQPLHPRSMEGVSKLPEDLGEA